MFKSVTNFVALVFVLIGIAFFLTSPSLGQPAVDHLNVKENDDMSFVSLGQGALDALPADFFGPGSDPFEGQIVIKPGRHLLGNPHDKVIFWENLPIQPYEPIGTSSWVPVEVVELGLVSQEPVTVTYLGGTNPELWNMVMTLSVVQPPAGTQHSTKTHVNGGTFESVFNVQPKFIFTRVADGMVVEWDTGLAGLPFLELEASGGHWVHDPDPRLGLSAPSAGMFVSCVLEEFPGDPASHCPAPLPVLEPTGAMFLELVPAELLPEPDPFCSVPGDQPDGSHINFGPSDNPPLPAGFFGPGSDPFTGSVPLIGEPLGPTPWGDYEDADTLIRREADPFNRCEIPSADYRSVDFYVLAMNLRSLEPITVTYSGGQFPELWDVQMTGSSFGDYTGFMAATKTHVNGGIFEIHTTWQPSYVFTRIGDGHQVFLDVGQAGGNFLDYEVMDGNWVHTVFPGLDLLTPSDGQFVPGVEEMVFGDPGSQETRTLHFMEFSGAGVLAFRPTFRDVSGIAIPAAPAASLQVVPNPFNPVTTISFELAQGGPISLRIYDLRGKRVRTLVQADLPAGRNEVLWYALDDGGRRVASGVYLSVLKTATGVQTAKMAVIK